MQGVAVEAVGGLKAGDVRAAPGQQPSEVALPATGIQNQRIANIAQQPEQGWVQLILAGQVAFVAKPVDHMLGDVRIGVDDIGIGQIVHRSLAVSLSTGGL